jgi:flagellar protein FliS
VNARNAYASQMVDTASPARLLVMLLERLARDVAQAAEEQERGDFRSAGPLLIHAQQIVLELRTSLRHDVWDGATQLESIYAFLHSQLIRANTSRDATVTRDCQRLVDPLVETWRQAALASLVG